jgi:drug/metabolite transporter (DMT)-like permease
MMERRLAGISLALLAALCYGTVPVMARLAFQAGIPAIESIALRTFTVALLFSLVAAVLRLPSGMTRAALPAFAGQALATLGVSLCYLLSVQYISVSLAVVIFFTFPVIVVVVSPLVEGHRPSWLVMAIAALAFTGLAIAVGSDIGALDWRGLVLAAGAAVACALQFFTGRLVSQHMQPAAFAGAIHAVILLPVMAVAGLLGGGHVQAVENPAVGVGALAAMGGVSLAYLAGYFFHMSSLKAARASTVVPFFNFEPVVSAALARMVLGESLDANQYLGGAIVLASLVLCSLIGFRSASHA